MKESNKKQKSRLKLIVEKGTAQIRKIENEKKLESRKRKMLENKEVTLDLERKRSRLSLKKQRKMNPEKVKESQSKRQAKSRQVNSAQDRL